MKIQVRQGMFETNSSSTHAICINTKGSLNMPDKNVQLRAEGNINFGWEVKQYHGVQDKLEYLWRAIISAYSRVKDIKGYVNDNKWQPIFEEWSIDRKIRKVIELQNKIETWLKDEEGYKIYLANPIISILPKKDGTNDYWASLDIHSGNGYIDHGNECIDFVEGIMENKDIFMHYLFCDDSCVCTGNDNDGDIDYPDKSTYDLDFYKGN